MSDSIWDTVAHLKDIAAVVTPVLIAVIGLRINSTIQKQNRIAERQSALVKQWADEFSKLTTDIDRTATRVIIKYFQAAYRQQLVTGSEEEFFIKMNSEIREIALTLEEQRMGIDKYIKLAPRSGERINRSFEELHDVCRKWFSDKGGDTENFRTIQARFNESARETHREILRLDD